MGRIIFTDTATLLQLKLPVKRRDVVVRDSDLDSEYTYSNDDDTQSLSGSGDFYFILVATVLPCRRGIFIMFILRRTC